MTTDDYRKRDFGEAACVVKRIRETHTHTHIRKEVDHWSDPLGTESQNMQLDIYIYMCVCVCIYIYIGYGVHQLRLKMRPGAPPKRSRYVYTGPGEVSSLIADSLGTLVIPCFCIFLKIMIYNAPPSKFYVCSDVSHTHTHTRTHTRTHTHTLTPDLPREGRTHEIGDRMGD